MTLDSDYIQSLVVHREEQHGISEEEEEEEDNDGVSFYETKRVKATRKKNVTEEEILKGRPMEFEVLK